MRSPSSVSSLKLTRKASGAHACRKVPSILGTWHSKYPQIAWLPSRGESREVATESFLALGLSRGAVLCTFWSSK